MGVLVVRIGAEEVESCSDWLFQLGATAIEERVAAEEPTLIAGFADDDAALAARSLLVERWPCRLESTGDEAEWRDEWLKWIEPIEVAGFMVHAPWHDPSSWSPDLPGLSIDPGRAFGSGHHPTTRLALAALRQTVGPHARVLDVGCGTGILSIAVAKMNAAAVVGIDLDYDTLAVAEANVEANNVASKVSLRTEPVETISERFDIVVANIVVGDLAPLMPSIVDLADHYVVISGFLDEQFDRLIHDVDVNVVERTTCDDWGCATLAPTI